ncbi:MAG: methyltransferase domain-containing protein [Gemmatimonadetes bacterium]|nr:methyltransferase domain-containing protein [Gemmatimonadota bacterium]
MSSKDYFDRVAQDWDEMRESFFSDEVREEALSTAAVQKGKTAADIGAGTGFISEGLRQKGLQVIAVDQSEAILKEMKRKFSDIETIDYRVGQAQNLPIPDATVDYAFANMYLHHVEFPSGAIAEMVRILKPSGKLVITDLDEHEFNFLREEHHDRWMGFKRADIEKWFQSAGLRDIHIDSIGTCCEARSSCGSEFASIGIFLASGEK